jgi:hypothetical protein
MNLDNTYNTTKASNPMLKLPGFGGGFKLDLTKVPEANVITEKDKERMKNKDLPTISKNNFTEAKEEIKGNVPKKLNLISKDSLTKFSNDSSVPSLKILKNENPKKLDNSRNNEFKFDKSIKSKGKRKIHTKSLLIENSEVSSLFESESDENNKMPLYKRKPVESPHDQELIINRNKLTPNLVRLNDSSEYSDRSKGSYVGSNRVFIPSLNIQEDVINKEIREKQQMEEDKKVRREQDKDNPRFQMQKSKVNKKNLSNLMKSNESKPEVMQFIIKFK